MLVVDASCVVEMVLGGPRAHAVRREVIEDTDLIAPHCMPAEVFAVIRREYQRRAIDATAAGLALGQIRQWPGELVAHGALIPRAWALRDSVGAFDALYVSLAEAMSGRLLTLDGRLGRTPAVRCEVRVVTQ